MWQNGNGSNKSKLFSRRCYVRLNSGNICFHSVKNLLSCLLLCKRAKIVIRGYKTTVLRVVINVCVYPEEKNAG